MSTTTPGTSKELLERVDDAWRPFRDAVRGLGRGRIEERTSVGWTFRDLIAHVAAWEEATPDMLRDLRAGKELRFTQAEIDEFNARAVAQRRLVGSEALLDELDTAHRRLVEGVRQLTDEEVRDRRFLGTVAENTYRHYADHAGELAVALPVTRQDMAERGLDGW